MSRTKHPPQDPRSGKILIWGAAALVALASLGIVVLLWPEPDRPHPQATEPPAATTAAPSAGLDLTNMAELVTPEEVPEAPAPAAEAETVPAPSPTLEAIDLFAEPAPEIISRGHEFAAAGRPLRSSKVKMVYDYGQSHPGDARPFLILALDSMNRGWYDFAIDHYRKATREDPRAKQDPRVLRDLLKMSGKKYQSAKARDAIVEIYGAQALPQVNSALSEAEAQGDDYLVEALVALKSRLDASGG